MAEFIMVSQKINVKTVVVNSLTILPKQLFLKKQNSSLIDDYWREFHYEELPELPRLRWSWLQDYVNQRLAHTPRQIEVLGKSLGRLTIACDQMWSFVDSKKNEVYLWLAVDRDSRKIIGCFLGDQTRTSADKLWTSLPDIYQQCAVTYTDFWQA